MSLHTTPIESAPGFASAYRWSDLAGGSRSQLSHGFHSTNQGERYTISETARRTVLDRLLALNHQRYEEEVKAGLHNKKKSKAKKVKSKLASGVAPPQPELIV